MVNFDIKETLSGRDYKAPALANYILEHHLENELVDYALAQSNEIEWRGIWIVDHCSEIDEKRIKPFHERLIKNLKKEKLHGSVIRCTLRIFQTQVIPKRQESFLLDKCYTYLKNPYWPIAIRSSSITVIFNISKRYPELIEELKVCLLHLMPSEADAAITSRIRSTLKEIEKLQPKSK
ncbi:MAG: hypothetical protein V4580_02425 [Bacteroidota bacterium]